MTQATGTTRTAGAPVSLLPEGFETPVVADAQQPGVVTGGATTVDTRDDSAVRSGTRRSALPSGIEPQRTVGVNTGGTTRAATNRQPGVQTTAQTPGASPTDAAATTPNVPGAQDAAPTETARQPGRVESALDNFSNIGRGKKGGLIKTGLSAIPGVGLFIGLFSALQHGAGAITALLRGDIKTFGIQLAKTAIAGIGAALNPVAPLATPAALLISDVAMDELLGPNTSNREFRPPTPPQRQT